MEISTKAIVIIAIAVLFLLVLSSFFLFNTGTQVSKAEAKRVFEERCLEYGTKQCTWDLTEQPVFSQFVTACKILYGEEREAFSCLYSLCSRCQNVALDNIRCESLCRGIRGQEQLGNGVAEACASYRADATCRSVQCGSCGAG